MAINPDLIPLSDYFSSQFTDKDSGLNLAGGTVEFYRASDQVTAKNVYKISGTPPNYTYTSLGSTLTLSASGTFQDGSNNNVVVYGYPYLGTPAAPTTPQTVDLYYAVIKNSDGTTQFTRIGFPNIEEAITTEDDDIENLIENGQFLLHNDIPASDANGHVVGKISQDRTPIAPGGWNFVRSNGSTATYLVTFERYASIATAPTSDPRYAVQIQIETKDATDTEYDLRKQFRFVNRFYSENITFNLYFEAQSVGSDITDCQIILIWNFGTGGSPSSETEVSIHNFDLTSTLTAFNLEVDFELPDPHVLGTNDDDYIEIAFRTPNEELTYKITNVCLTVDGDRTLHAFPVDTNSDQITKSAAGWLPTPNADGSDLLLPVWQTQAGFGYDYGSVGKVYPIVLPTVSEGYHLCDGARYKYGDYQSNGVPNSRLGDALWDSTLNIMRFGTGPQYFTAIYPNTVGVTGKFRVTQNTTGLATTASAGTSGFTLTSLHTGANYVNFTSFLVLASTLQLRGIYPGNPADTIVDGGTATNFTFSFIEGNGSVHPDLIGDWYQVVTGTAAAMAGAGAYFSFYMRDSGGVQQRYNPWYNIGGAGAAPGVGGTDIEIRVEAADNAADVAQKTMEALNGWQMIEVATVAASSLSGGEYFTVYSPNATAFNVYYVKDGVGSAPGTDYDVAVDIVAADTADGVATKSRTAINKAFFAVPDLQGTFVRGWDNGAGRDPNAANRYAYVPNYFGDQIGTSQWDMVRSHYHSVPNTLSNIAVTGATNGLSNSGSGNNFTGNQGLAESRPVNVALNWMIKY